MMAPASDVQSAYSRLFPVVFNWLGKTARFSGKI
jgi:hypothetical protein